LRDFIDIPDVYAAGRLDADSEGLLVLTSNGRLQQQLTNPRFGHLRTYWVQVEGSPQPHQLQRLRDGITIQGYRTRPAKAAWLNAEAIPTIGERIPPIRVRAAIPTHWLEISLQEGRNRQVRRMTAAVGLPTLRLIRHTIDLMDGGTPLTLKGLEPGAWRAVSNEEDSRLVRLLRGSNPRNQAGRRRG
jgi:23S rRNA pseudouridine2457 synthase